MNNKYFWFIVSSTLIGVRFCFEVKVYGARHRAVPYPFGYKIRYYNLNPHTLCYKL